MMTMERGSSNRYGALIEVSLSAESASEARQRVEQWNWIWDLSGHPTKVVPIFPYMRQGTIQRATLIGVLPKAKENLQKEVIGYTAVVWVEGTSLTMKTYQEFLKSCYWYTGDDVQLENICTVFDANKVAKERLV